MRIPLWLQVVGTIAILAVVLWHVPVEKLLAAAQSAELIWFVPAAATTLVMLFFRHSKWHRLLRAASLEVSQTDSLRSLLCGFALSVPTPGRVGELGRCLFLPEKVRSQALQLNILERVLDAWAVFTYGVASLMVIQFRPVGVFALAVWLAVLPVFLGLPGLLNSASQWNFWRGAVRVHLRSGSQALAQIRTAPFAVWALLTTSLDLLIFYFLLQAFHPTGFVAILIAFPWMIIAGGLPIAVGGIGPREGVAAYILTHRAVPAAAAMDVALFLFAFSAALPAVAGGIWMMSRRLRRADPPPSALENVTPGA
jgi:glycosyltransferase 2 family protein